MQVIKYHEWATLHHKVLLLFNFASVIIHDKTHYMVAMLLKYSTKGRIYCELGQYSGQYFALWLQKPRFKSWSQQFVFFVQNKQLQRSRMSFCRVATQFH